MQVVKYPQLHFSTLTLPIQFISTDLIGPFDHSSNGYYYSLMMVCILRGYTFCIPWNTKIVSKVIQAYIDELYAKFWGSMNSLSAIGQNLKINCSQMWLPQLGVEQKVYSPPYHHQSNGIIIIIIIIIIFIIIIIITDLI